MTSYDLQKLSTPLELKDAEKFLNTQIDGSVLAGAADEAFFRRASLSFGASVKLAGLSSKISFSKRPSDTTFKKLRPESEIDTKLEEPELSDPAFKTKLPFPIDSKDGEHNWVYIGPEKFVELLNKLKQVQGRPQNSGFWLYGTRGYGKSHRLAALVRYLTAREERVVYIPDCRECFKYPVPYTRAEMLFTWSDND
ncbi:hypothetical protein HOY80DRAFT_1110745 [Tuber brumale]|nr:hypothetical protein HOY80DRAFT_1110745 [Tuber brumale]